MEWFKKHADTVAVLIAMFSGVMWMNGKFNDMDKRFSAVDVKFAEIKQEIAVIKTVLMLKGIMPNELAVRDINKDGE